MKQIKYGFYGEDDAQKIFLKNYLQLLPNTQFEIDEEFCTRFRARNKREVDTKFKMVSQEGLLWYQLDVLFIGRDLDSHVSGDYFEKFRKFQNEAHDAKKTLFMIPVQAIEHWLWYLKIKKDNPTSTKNQAIENKPRRDAKQFVYGIPEAVNAISNPIVENLSAEFEVSWLESRSESFRHFNKQIQDFLVQNNN